MRSYLFYSVFILALFSSKLCWQDLFASQTAYIGVDQAIIYANQDLTAPIGYVLKGKQVFVGEVARKRGTLLPIYVAGKIAYIKISDLVLAEESAEGAYSTTPTLSRSPITSSNARSSALELTYNQLSPSNSWDQFSSSIGDNSTNSIYHHYRLAYQYFSSKWDLFAGFGISYYQLSQPLISLSQYGLEAILYWNAFTTDPLAMDLYAGGIGVPLFALDLNVNNTLESQKGWGLGNQLGAQFRLFPTSGINFILGADYKILYMNATSTTNSSITFEGLDGLNIFAGLSVKF